MGNSRLKEKEINALYDIVENPGKYDGAKRTIKQTKTDYSSDGKYTRKIEQTYTLRSDRDGVRIEEHYQHHDDDGDSYESDTVHDGARDLVGLLDTIFKIFDAFVD